VNLVVLLLMLWPQTTGAVVAMDRTDLELAGRAETAFQDGVKLRDKGEHGRAEFLAAVACYEELRHRGIDNAELEHNLGNAYFLADDLPHAILSYRRGLRLSPLNPTLRGCLQEAREQVVYPDNTAFGRPALVHGKLLLPGWASSLILATAAVLYGLGCAAVTRWLMVRRIRWVAGGGGILLVAGFLTVLLIQVARSVGAEDTHPLVVVAEDGVLLRKGDGLAFPPRYDTVVNRGVEARLLFEREGWMQIELATGEVGWVAREYVLVDRP
jgi:hypothetical protein